MINLIKGLPNAILVDGKPIFIKTSYKIWIKVYTDIMNGKTVKFDEILVDNVTLNESEYKQFIKGFTDFLYNPNPTPNYSHTSQNLKIFDYILDSEYIWSAFMKTYNIDLLETDMHWHKFKALCDELSSDTLFGHAKRARSYKKLNKNYNEDKYWQEEKNAWSLPLYSDEEKQKKIDEFNKYFG